MPDSLLSYPKESDADPSESSRAARKAQTRRDLRRVAQELFAARSFDAVTIASIAAAASVSVQTVFNHFTTKEDLFFDGRATWVEGPANAVRRRGAQVPALTTLRNYLVEHVRNTVRFEATVEGRRYTSAISASPILSSRERELVHETEHRLSQALAEAWGADASGIACGPSDDPATNAALTAATWLAAARVLIIGQRPLGDEERQRASNVAALTDRTLRSLEGHWSPQT
jgi:AcrR family transcriptional regulator